jgi:multiple sugar transport system substrate-binding protein
VKEEDMKKLLVLICSLVFLFAFSSSVFGKAKTKVTKEEIILRIWFWGEDEAPGLKAWLDETGKLYKQKYPNISLETEILAIDAIYPRFTASVAAGDPPDLHMLWGGVLGLEQCWAGNVTPISDFWTEKDLGMVYSGVRGEGYWNGKQWSIPLYIDPWLAAINKDVWRKSGLDPEKPPIEWADFVKALEKIKAAGFTPWAVGIKDGYYGAWFPSLLQYQYFDSFTDLHRAVVGEVKLTDPKQSGWWHAIQELRDKGLFNSDATSIALAEGNNYFLRGDVGFVLGVQPLIAYYIKEMGIDKVGVMIPPSPGKGKLKGYLPVPSGAALYIPKNAKHKAEAADFLKFMYSKERQNALHKQTGAFGGSNLLDPAVINYSQNKLIYEWMKKKPTTAYNFNYPGAFEEALYSIGQLFMAGDIDAAEAAKQYEEAAEKWRQNNPEQVKNFKIWIEKPFKP